MALPPTGIDIDELLDEDSILERQAMTERQLAEAMSRPVVMVDPRSGQAVPLRSTGSLTAPTAPTSTAGGGFDLNDPGHLLAADLTGRTGIQRGLAAERQVRAEAATRGDVEELVGGPVTAGGQLGDMPAPVAMAHRQEAIRRIRAGKPITPEQFRTLTPDEQSYAWANEQRDRVRQMSVDDWRRVPHKQRERLVRAGATPEPAGVRPERAAGRIETKVLGGGWSIAGTLADAPRAVAELPEAIMEASLRERGMLTPGLKRDVKRPKIVQDLLGGIEMAEQIAGTPRNQTEVVADSVAGLIQLFGEVAVMHKPSMATGRLLRSSLGKIFASKQIPAMAGWMGTIGMFGAPRTYSQVATGHISAEEGAKHVTGAGLSLLADVPAGVMRFVRNMATMPKRPSLRWFEDTVHAIEPAAHLFVLHQGFKAGRRMELAGKRRADTDRARVDVVDRLERTSRTVTQLADLAAEQRAERIRRTIERRRAGQAAAETAAGGAGQARGERPEVEQAWGERQAEIEALLAGEDLGRRPTLGGKSAAIGAEQMGRRPTRRQAVQRAKPTEPGSRGAEPDFAAIAEAEVRQLLGKPAERPAATGARAPRTAETAAERPGGVGTRVEGRTQQEGGKAGQQSGSEQVGTKVAAAQQAGAEVIERPAARQEVTRGQVPAQTPDDRAAGTGVVRPERGAQEPGGTLPQQRAGLPPARPGGVARAEAPTVTAEATAEAPAEQLGKEAPLYDRNRREYRVRYAAVPLADLVVSHEPGTGRMNPAYPQGLQARDRSSAASLRQVEQIAGDLRPELLVGEHLDATSGPPVVWRDPKAGQYYVIAGNGRVMALNRAPAEAIGRYHQAVTERAESLGIKRVPEGTALVRVLDAPDIETAKRMAASSQEGLSAQQTDLERAVGRAREVGLEDVSELPGFASPKEPITRDNVLPFLAENARLRNWLRERVGDRWAELESNPEAAAELVNDLMAATLPRQVHSVAQAASKDVEAMFQATAAPMAALTREVDTGNIEAQYDLARHLADAAELFKLLKGRKGSIGKLLDDLDEVAETPTFGGTGFEDVLDRVSAEGVALAVAFARAASHKASAAEMLTKTRNYLEAARDATHQEALFGDKPTAGELIADHFKLGNDRAALGRLRALGREKSLTEEAERAERAYRAAEQGVTTETRERAENAPAPGVSETEVPARATREELEARQAEILAGERPAESVVPARRRGQRSVALEAGLAELEPERRAIVASLVDAGLPFEVSLKVDPAPPSLKHAIVARAKVEGRNLTDEDVADEIISEYRQHGLGSMFERRGEALPLAEQRQIALREAEQDLVPGANRLTYNENAWRLAVKVAKAVRTPEGRLTTQELGRAAETDLHELFEGVYKWREKTDPTWTRAVRQAQGEVQRVTGEGGSLHPREWFATYGPEVARAAGAAPRGRPGGANRTVLRQTVRVLRDFLERVRIVRRLIRQGKLPKSEAMIRQAFERQGAEGAARRPAAEPAETFATAVRGIRVRSEEELRPAAERIRQQAKRYTQPELDRVVRPIVRALAARYTGHAKSVESLIGKTRRKQHEGVPYTLEKAKDHARGAIILRHWRDAPKAVARLQRLGFAVEITIREPLNYWGYRGVNSSRAMGDGLNGEIQVHTESSWRLKEKFSDPIFRKWRDELVEDLSKQQLREFYGDVERSWNAWANYFGKVPLATKSRISFALRRRESVRSAGQRPLAGSQLPLFSTDQLSGRTRTTRPSSSRERIGSAIEEPPSTSSISAGGRGAKGKIENSRDQITYAIRRHLDEHTRQTFAGPKKKGEEPTPSERDAMDLAAEFAKRQQHERPLGRGRAKRKPLSTDWTEQDRQVAEQVMTQAAYHGKDPNPAGLARLAHRLEKFVLGSAQLDPRKLSERAVGRTATARVTKAAHHAEAELLGWENEKVAAVADATYGALGELLDKTYTPEQLLDFATSRGKPVTPEGRQIQAAATQRLPKGLADRGLREAIQEIYDHNYRLLSQVAEGDVSYVQDYFYGLYKDREAVRRFLDHYRTTTRYLHEKKIPTVADAIAFDLELRNVNPVWNARAEARHIYQRAAMQELRDNLIADGEGRFITEYDDAEVWQRRYWEYVPDEPLLKGLLMEPALAKLVRNMIAVNQVSKSKFWSGVRNTNNVLRSMKFLGSAFHGMVIAKQSIADSGLLGFLDPRKAPTIAKQTLNPGFRPRRVRAMTDAQFKAFVRGDKVMRRRVTAELGLTDPTFTTPEYVEYVRLGGGHKYSIESEAQQFLDRVFDTKPMNRLLRIGTWPVQAPLRHATAGPRAFVRWMFDRWIPAVKHFKYLQEVEARGRKLRRGLTDSEKQDIIREGQNFYGEMNERLFGRSGTATSILRFFFLAPGFREGNYRTLWKATTQWRGDRAVRSRRNIPQSLLLSGMLATVGTRILTDEWPDPPSSLQKFRDLFKIRTTWKDHRDRRIYIDVLTYDKDYFEQLVKPAWKLATGHPVEAAFEGADVLMRTAGGMTSPALGLATDMARWVQGEPIVDWRGERIWYEHDPALTKVFKFAASQWERTEPIASSVARRMIARKTSPGVAILTAVAGMRPATSEHEKELAETARDVWSLRDEQEQLYYHLGTLKDPRGKIDRYNRMVDRVVADREIPKDLRDTVGRLKIDTDRLVANKVMKLTGPSADEEDVTKALAYLRNFGVDRARAEELLKGYQLSDNSTRGRRLRAAGRNPTRRMRNETVRQRLWRLRKRWGSASSRQTGG